MWRNVLLAMAFTLAGSAWAAGSQDVVAKNVWVNETVPGQTKASVNLDLTTTASPGRLVAVDSPVAESGGIERVWVVHGKATRQPVSAVQMRRGRAVAFRENGMSVVLIGLKQPLKVGDQVPINLTVITGGKKVVLEVKAEVKAAELSYKKYEEVEKHQQ